ncbi:hypothetical protein PSZ20_23340, partial [Shigella flexneri]|nr:hypothetical protein [Shigella flexneri]
TVDKWNNLLWSIASILLICTAINRCTDKQN